MRSARNSSRSSSSAGRWRRPSRSALMSSGARLLVPSLAHRLGSSGDRRVALREVAHHLLGLPRIDEDAVAAPVASGEFSDGGLHRREADLPREPRRRPHLLGVEDVMPLTRLAAFGVHDRDDAPVVADAEVDADHVPRPDLPRDGEPVEVLALPVVAVADETLVGLHPLVLEQAEVHRLGVVLAVLGEADLGHPRARAGRLRRPPQLGGPSVLQFLIGEMRRRPGGHHDERPRLGHLRQR